MIQEIDRRDYDIDRATPQRRENLQGFATDAAGRLPGAASVRVGRLNPLSGTAAHLETLGTEPVSGSLLDAAIAQIQLLARPLGFEAGGPLPEFVPDPTIQRTMADVAVVHLQQQHRGVPVFQMTRTVQFAADRRARSVGGDHAPVGPDVDTTPRIAVADAVMTAARYLAEQAGARNGDTDQFGQAIEPIRIDLDGFTPRTIAAFNDPKRSTVLDGGPFDRPITAHLVVFHTGPRARLGWLVNLALPQAAADYAVIVAADAERETELLFCQPLSRHMAIGRGEVYEENPDRTPRRSIGFPRPAAEYPEVLNAPPNGFPGEWIERDEAVGNNVVSTRGNTTQTLGGTVNAGEVVFAPPDDTGDDQKVLNIFYFCNYAHDFFELLGFDEASGNFQSTNRTGHGAAGDPVVAKAHPGPVRGTANMRTYEDGVPAEMNMGLVGGINRHTAFDIDVVMHEYAHGVTNRLVGGRMDRYALQQPQSRGMGEGWSDYYALTVQNANSPNEKTVTGDWVTGRPGGIRGFPYDSSFPDGFGNLGSGRYVFDSQGSPPVHAIGEIWCASLMEMTRRAVDAIGNQRRAYAISWQVVTDGFKLAAANPSFLDARDEVLQALADLNSAGAIGPAEHADFRRVAWEAFASYGMGVYASSAGASLHGITADDTLPADL